MRIGKLDIPVGAALAPMAGVCDLAFRTVCREHGAVLTYTEMVSAKALTFNDQKTKTLMRLGEAEHPAGVQIFGSDPECMAGAAKLAFDAAKPDFIDINMGCPVGKVVKSGDGSALMLKPELAGEIIRAVRDAVPCPVTVKIRKGWDKGSVNAVEFARMAEEAGVSAITVHGRTRSQMYSGLADRSIIRDVKQAVSVPVIANGDIFSAEDAIKMLRYTGADMVMVGRGAFGDPWIFSEILAALEGREIPEKPPLRDRVETARRQFELARQYKGERIACLEARKHYAWYLRGVAHSGYFKEQISKIETMDDIDRITEGIKRELR